MGKDNKIVGHKTFVDERGNFSHEPLTSDEADSMWEAAKSAKANRAALMPDEQSAIRAMWEAHKRLRELGWSEIIYCPKDGTVFDAIEPGSTGIHKCHYHGEWPKGSWWISAHGDMWPALPVLFRIPAPPPIEAD